MKKGIPTITAGDSEFLRFAKIMNKNAEIDLKSPQKNDAAFLLPLMMKKQTGLIKKDEKGGRV